MSKTANIFLVVISFLLIGCVGPVPVKLDSGETITILRRERDSFYIPKSDTKGYYILLEQKQANNPYSIKRISRLPIKRTSLSEEILFLTDNLLYISPAFESFRIRETTLPSSNMLVHFFSCNDSDLRGYTPCNSKLIKYERLYEPWGGQYDDINSSLISQIIKSTDLIAQVRRFQDQAEKCENDKRFESAQQVWDEIKVQPRIVDESGFYLNERIFDYKKIISSPLECPFDLEKTSYSVSLWPTIDSYEMKIEPSSYDLSYSPNGYTLNPEIRIRSKKFSRVFPKYSNEDDSLKIDFDGSEIFFSNKTNQFIQITSLSTYYQGEVSNYSFEKPLEIPPHANTKGQSLRRHVSESINRAADYNITKDLAKTIKISFGFAVKYDRGGKGSYSLYKEKKYELYTLLMTSK